MNKFDEAIAGKVYTLREYILSLCPMDGYQLLGYSRRFNDEIDQMVKEGVLERDNKTSSWRTIYRRAGDNHYG